MRRGAWVGGAGAAVVVAVFVAGFAYSEGSPAPGCPPARSLAKTEHAGDTYSRVRREAEEREGLHLDRASGPHFNVMLDSSSREAAPAKPGLLALVNAPGYKRAADFTLKVADCTKAEDALEAKLEAIRGEILEMLMEGTEGSRTCTLSILIPSDKFRAFVQDLRQMGKVQSERITASKLKPGRDVAAGAEAKGDPDPRELALVAVRMADEKVSPVVLQGRGILATSFDQSASHFMKGAAVLVEGFGYALPYLIVAVALAMLGWIASRVRRPRMATVRIE